VPKLMVVDDDPRIRNLIRTRMKSEYEIVDTGDPDLAFGLALEHKPDAILLDLMMPGYSGFELCQSLHNVSYTSRIPVFIVTGESGNRFREHCKNLGARGYFEKPIDFPALKAALSLALTTHRVERRAHLRVQLKILLNLVETTDNGNQHVHTAATENISAGGFLCQCEASLAVGCVLPVYLAGPDEQYVGKARVVRKDGSSVPWPKYGFQFIEKTSHWLLQ